MSGLEGWSPMSCQVTQIVLNPEEIPEWIILLVVAEIIVNVSLGHVLFSVFQVVLFGT